MPSSDRPALVRSTVAVVIGAILVALSVSAVLPMDAAAACGSFQARVDKAAPGGTITIPKCTFHESVVVNKRLTIKAFGATIDAGGAAHGILIQANGVTIRGLRVTNASGGAHDGAIHSGGASRLTLKRVRVFDSATVCLSLNGGSGHRILRSVLKRCGKEGFFGNGLSNTLFRHVKVHHNNTDLAWDPQTEAGGGKIMASTGITFARTRVWANGGPGIWFDNGVKSVVVKYNRTWGNHESGIMFEISNEARIYGNKVWANGFGHAAWGFGAGILISSSDNASVHHNTVAWNARGISVISQDRPTSPHKGNVIHDNVVISHSGSFVTGFYDDHGGSLFSAANGNRGYDNRYWVGASQPSSDRFHWNGSRTTLAAYNATRGEARGHYISKATRNRILREKHIPLS